MLSVWPIMPVVLSTEAVKKKVGKRTDPVRMHSPFSSLTANLKYFSLLQVEKGLTNFMLSCDYRSECSAFWRCVKAAVAYLITQGIKVNSGWYLS